MKKTDTPWERVKGPGMYPVEYAGWLLSPLRSLIAPAAKIANRLDLKPNDDVLEIGCGPGFFGPAIAKEVTTGRMTLLDAQEGMIRIAAARLARHRASNFQACVGSAEALPFADETFDVTFMVTVLGEISDRRKAMAEATRVLRRGGRLSITEAAGDPDRVKREEIGILAESVGLVAERAWAGLFISTFNYLRPTSSV